MSDQMPRDGLFWKYISVGAPDECWPWERATNQYGYGIFYRGRDATGKLRYRVAHRMALELSGADVPDKNVVMHICDNPPCCNPAHLRVGTQGDNMADCASKGRSAKGFMLPQTKLSDAVVADIRARRENGELIVDLAREYGVSHSLVSMIVHGKRRAA